MYEDISQIGTATRSNLYVKDILTLMMNVDEDYSLMTEG